MADEAWKTTFDIVKRTERHEDGDLGSYLYEAWDVVNRHSGHVEGTYQDYKYAKKQARHKYKLIVRLIEKSFMT